MKASAEPAEGKQLRTCAALCGAFGAADLQIAARSRDGDDQGVHPSGALCWWALLRLRGAFSARPQMVAGAPTRTIRSRSPARPAARQLWTASRPRVVRGAARRGAARDVVPPGAPIYKRGGHCPPKILNLFLFQQ